MVEPRKVLVVDDAQFIRTLLKRILAPPDFVVTEASNVADALARYREVRPDIVICDLLMPGANGFSFISQVKDFDPRARIVVCTADIQNTSHEKAIEIGAAGFLNKPFTRDSILSAIDTYCPPVGDEESHLSSLTPEQRDALLEIVNIGIGKAAAGLSQMINRRVELTIPDLDLKKMSSLQRYYSRHFAGDAIAVRQRFDGPFSGDALLLFPKDGGRHLVSVLVDREAAPPDIAESDQSALTEIGNILISACVGTFGNILKTEVRYTSPTLVVGHVSSIINDISGHEPEATKYGLVIKTEFTIKRSHLHGFLVLVLGFESIDFLRRAIDKMLV